jgi:SpoIID/LytB domain protein
VNAPDGTKLHDTASPKRIDVRPGAGTTLQLWSRPSAYDRYRGVLRVIGETDASPRADVINELPMESYLRGVVPAEVPAGWPAEALKAQAIAARSYAYRRVANPRSSTYDIDSTTIDQAFNGVDIALGENGKRWTDAVDATDGQILTFNGAPIEALYSASNGGFITSGGYVFGTDQPYLRDDADPFDDVPANPLHEWTRQYTGAELGQFLKTARNIDVGTVTSVAFNGNVSTTGRVDRAEVKLTGSTGSATITGAQFKAMINQSAPQGRRLPSTLLFLPAFGAVDSMTVSKGELDVSGWVGLRGSTSIAVAQVTVDGKVMATTAGSIERPDVAKRVGTGATPGFHVHVPLPAGTTAKSKVCVSASMPNGASPTVLSCRTVPSQAKAESRTAAHQEERRGSPGQEGRTTSHQLRAVRADRHRRQRLRRGGRELALAGVVRTAADHGRGEGRQRQRGDHRQDGHVRSERPRRGSARHRQGVLPFDHGRG